MDLLIIGLILFFGVHSISILADNWRNQMAARLGQWIWKGLYGLVALAGLVLIVRGYAEARLDPRFLYVPPEGLRPLAVALLLPVFPLLFAAYLPGRIQAAVGHPMLVATLLWAIAHLLANGTLADVLLFGTFLVWAAADLASLKRRAPRPVPAAPATRFNDAIALTAGIGLYIAFVLGAHAWLVGVPAFAR